MNDIIAIQGRIAEMEKRQAMAETEKGVAQIEQEIISIFGALVAYGYKMPDADKKLMAKLWGNSLKEYFVLYGTGVIKRAVVNFAENDLRDYKQFPTVAEIIQEAKKIGVNPKAELAKLKAQEVEERLYEEHRAEYNKLYEELPEERKKEIQEQWESGEWKIIIDNYNQV